MGLDAKGDASLAVAVSSDGVRLLRAGKEASFVESAAPGGSPLCCDISPSGDQIAVGLEDSKKVMIITVSGDSLGDATELFVAPGDPTVIRYSPDGAHLQSATTSVRSKCGTLRVQRSQFAWGCESHSAPVTAMAWSPDNKHKRRAALISRFHGPWKARRNESRCLWRICMVQSLQLNGQMQQPSCLQA